MGMLRPWHIIVLVIVILLLFGARRLPDLARSVGQSLKIFKSEVKDLKDDDKTNDAGAQAPYTTPAGGQTPYTPPPTYTSPPAYTTPPPTATPTERDASATPRAVDPDAPKA